MTRPQVPIDQELHDLKSTLDEHLLTDYDEEGLRHRILSHIHGQGTDGLMQPNLRKQDFRVRWWRRLSQPAAGIAAVVIVVVALTLYSGGFQSWAHRPNGSPVVTQSPGLFSAGFQPISTLEANQFQHVDGISLLLGNNWGFQTPLSIDGASIQLTPAQQREFYQIMQSNKQRTMSKPVLQTTSLPFPFKSG